MCQCDVHMRLCVCVWLNIKTPHLVFDSFKTETAIFLNEIIISFWYIWYRFQCKHEENMSNKAIEKKVLDADFVYAEGYTQNNLW